MRTSIAAPSSEMGYVRDECKPLGTYQVALPSLLLASPAQHAGDLSNHIVQADAQALQHACRNPLAFAHEAAISPILSAIFEGGVALKLQLIALLRYSAM